MSTIQEDLSVLAAMPTAVNSSNHDLLHSRVNQLAGRVITELIPSITQSITDSVANSKTSILGGVNSAGDNLSKLYTLIQSLTTTIQSLSAIVGSSSPDADNIVNTVSELLQVFSTYQEGVNILTLLNSKVDSSSLTTSLATKANLNAPTFTGIVTVPTPTSGTNTTQAASTAYVVSALAALSVLKPIDIANILTQTTTGKVLDATQGKILKDALDALTTLVNAGVDLYTDDGSGSSTLSGSGTVSDPLKVNTATEQTRIDTRLNQLLFGFNSTSKVLTITFPDATTKTVTLS